VSDGPIDEPQPPAADAAGYVIGYGKPPKEHCFPKGTTGNPRGRPPKKRQQQAADQLGNSRGLSEAQRLWLEEANTPIPVSFNGRVEEVTAQRAVMLSLRKKALAGNPRALDLYLKHTAAAQATVRAMDVEAFEALVHYKQVFEQEVRHRTFLGRAIDDILPHPADVIVNPRTGFHKIAGPLDEHERRQYNESAAALVTLQERVSEAAEAYHRANRARRGPLLEEWHKYQSWYDQINDQLPPSLQRELIDRSMEPGATQPGDFFSWTPEAIEAFVRKTQRVRRRRRRA
jgi:hypothetical protein